MDRARRLLQCADVKINEVARQVGYETAASFTRFFRKQTGVSPQEYRDGKQRQTT
jgi:two-component system response regulator YesN